MIFVCDKYSESIGKLREALKYLGVYKKIVVLDENSFLPENVLSPYEYYISKQNCEQHAERELHYDALEMPKGWTVWSDGMSVGNRYMRVYYMGCDRVFIYFRELQSNPIENLVEPPEQKIVQRVEWRMEDGWIYRVDYYNKYGLKYASEFRDADGTVESKVFYSDRNQEVIVEYPENDVVTLLEHGCVKAFFNSHKEFIEHFISEVTTDEKIAFFIQNDEMLEALNIKPDTKQVWDFAWFSDNDLLDKYRSLGGKNGIRFYEISEHYPINEVKGEALILTRYDKIEKIEELIQELPEMTFHIGANTMMSDTLMNLEKRGNVKLYPGLSQDTLDELWKKCDFYLDINLYGEIRDAVNVAQQKNLLVMGFDDTVHHPELLAKECVYPAQEYRKMVSAIKYILKSPESIHKLLTVQQGKRKEIYKKLLQEKDY